MQFLLASALLLPGLAQNPKAEPRFELVWELREQRVTHTLRCEGGNCLLQTVRVREYAPVAEAPVSFDGAELIRQVAFLGGELGAVPPIAHNVSSFAGVKVVLVVEQTGEKRLRLESFNYYHKTLEGLYRAAADAAGESSRPAFEPLLALSRFRDAKAWEFSPGVTAKERLLEPLDPPSTDIELRRLALSVIAAQRLDEFAPRLGELFRKSKKKDPEGDYFLALALLRLGDLEGVERVLAVAQSAHPSWAMEASRAIEEAFGAAFGRRVLPPYDFRSPEDPRPAAVEAFRAWLQKERERLAFDHSLRSFAKPSGSTTGVLQEKSSQR